MQKFMVYNMKSVVLISLLFSFCIDVHSQEVQSKKCTQCGKPISECQYKGKHPATCSTCGKVLSACPYKGHHPTYIKANGSTTLSLQFSNQSASRTISVTTDASNYTTYGVPNWCSVEGKTSSQFTLRITENTSSSARSGWMEIRTPNGKSARINISQSARPANNGTYIKIDGNTTVNKSYSATGTTETFYITTDADNWTTWSVPSWCTVENKTSSSFCLRVSENTSSDSRSDYMEVRTANGTSARLNISQSPANYLRVDGYTTTRNSHFSENGGTERFSVSTSASTYEVVLLPSWCKVESRSSTSFTIRCERNSSRSERSDWFKVKAAGKEIKIEVRQDAARGPSASIDNVWTTTPVFGCGMTIHVNFSVSGMNGKKGRVKILFYFADNTTPIMSWGSQLADISSYRPPYDDTQYSDFKTDIACATLAGCLVPGFYYLSFDVVILDDNGNQIARKNNTSFTFTRPYY